MFTVWGLEKYILSGLGHPTGFSSIVFHLNNVLLHGLNSIILFYILNILFANKKAAFLGAIFFILHPIQVESVAWVFGLKEVTAAALAFGSILIYLIYTKNISENNPTKKNIYLYIISIFLFIAAVLSKPTIIMLPAILILIDIFHYGRKLAASLLRQIPFISVSLFFILIITGPGYIYYNPGTEPLNIINKLIIN